MPPVNETINPQKLRELLSALVDRGTQNFSLIVYLAGKSRARLPYTQNMVKEIHTVHQKLLDEVFLDGPPEAQRDPKVDEWVRDCAIRGIETGRLTEDEVRVLCAAILELFDLVEFPQEEP